MVFSSPVFIFLFLPITFILNRLIKKGYSNILLLCASLVFYAWGEPIHVLLMLTCILINWLVGYFISYNTGRKRKLLLLTGLILDLSILGYYKYFTFLINTVKALCRCSVVPTVAIDLPIGISFFTFQAISYIIDVYKGTTEASKKPINVALYISFFPQLIAGPIVKYKDISWQIENRPVPSWINISQGFKRFIYGLGKKVLIANILGLCVDTVYTYDIKIIDPLASWIAAFAYSLQIYYDFSGYSDMAIGLGRMFGFTITENFNYPYLSRSISEFWRRWHISLGSWFREYVYIPLGGNKRGTLRTYINLGIVFLLTGLWHGAGLSFVIWGLYHCFFSIFERIGLQKILIKSKILSSLYMILIVNFGWVLFRAKDAITGIRIIVRMIFPWRHPDILIPTWQYIDRKTIFVFIIALIGTGVIQTITPKKLCSKWRNSIVEALFCTFIFVLSLAAIASDTYNPFIYFHF